jgi:hypothetical protein
MKDLGLSFPENDLAPFLTKDLTNPHHNFEATLLICWGSRFFGLSTAARKSLRAE